MEERHITYEQEPWLEGLKARKSIVLIELKKKSIIKRQDEGDMAKQLPMPVSFSD